MADLVIGVDASTTACKAIAWDAQGAAAAEGRAPIALNNPEPDGWEQDPEQWWRALGTACRQVVEAVGAERIAALCITHQRETFVVSDATGRPLYPALVWMDKRCTEELRALAAEPGFDGEAMHALTGKPVCTTPSVYKLRFLTKHRPEVTRPDAVVVLDVHAYLAWRLTGRCVTSLASADPMGLVDMKKRDWARSLLCDVGGMPRTESKRYGFPGLFEPGARLGALSERGSEHTGLPAGLALVAGAGDGQCAGLGAGIVAPGRAYLNLGTAIVSGVLARDYRIDRAFRTLYGAVVGSYFLETDLQGGTFTLSWLCERLLGRPVEALDELEEQARSIAPGSDGLMVVPYWNGVMNPYWDDEASGVMLGLRGHHGAAHLYRAILEGIAFEQRLHLDGVETAAGTVSELVATGGGSRSALWCQLLADVLQKPVVRAATREATALGAGMLAAVHAGFHPDLEAAAAAMTSLGERFSPGPETARYQELYGAIYAGIYPSVAERLRLLSRARSA